MLTGKVRPDSGESVPARVRLQDGADREAGGAIR